MEIREGIKFETGSSKYIIKADGSIYAYSNITNDYTVNCNVKYNEEVFKSSSFKITYYPYKEGDYCIRTWPSGKKTLGIAYSFMGTDLYFKSLENYAEEGGVIENYTYGLLQEPFRGIYQRPAFKNEIPKENIMNKEELLAEAKRRYPVGTVFECAHVKTPGKLYKAKVLEGSTIEFLPNCNGTDIYLKIKDGMYNDRVNNDHGMNQLLYFNGKWAEIIENKIENMNDLDKELKERESKLEQSTVNINWNVVFSKIGAKEFDNTLLVYGISNNKIKPNLIKHNNSRFQKLLIIRTNKSKHSGKTK